MFDHKTKIIFIKVSWKIKENWKQIECDKKIEKEPIAN